jgi:hypothetical protein
VGKAVAGAGRTRCAARAGEEGSRKEEVKEKKKKKGKRKWRKRKRKRDREREREREIAPAAMTRRARTPVGRDARIEKKQGVGTAIGFGCRDRFFRRLGDQAGNDFGWIELNDEKRFENIFSA